jgi:hypothetical protein
MHLPIQDDDQQTLQKPIISSDPMMRLMIITRVVFAVVLWLCPMARSFTVTVTTRSKKSSNSRLLKRQQEWPSSPLRTTTAAPGAALYYKNIDKDNDEDDNDASPSSSSLLLKTQARTPPGFQVARQAPPPVGGGINQQLILALTLNQLLILALASVAGIVALLVRTGGRFDLMVTQLQQDLPTLLDWTGQGSTIALFDFWPTPARLAWGVLGAIPLLAVSTWVERSDKVRFVAGSFVLFFLGRLKFMLTRVFFLVHAKRRPSLPILTFRRLPCA